MINTGEKLYALHVITVLHQENKIVLRGKVGEGGWVGRDQSKDLYT